MATTKVFNKRQQDIQQAVHSELVSMPRSNEYAEVKQRVKSAGLLEPRPGFYVGMMALNGVLLVATIVMACVVRHPLLVTLNAVMAAFVSGQLAFIMHDAGHHQVGRTNLVNAVIGVVHGNLLLGVDFVWWKNKHAEHHANPNHLDADPEIDIPILAYTEQQAREAWAWHVRSCAIKPGSFFRSWHSLRRCGTSPACSTCGVTVPTSIVHGAGQCWRHMLGCT